MAALEERQKRKIRDAVDAAFDEQIRTVAGLVAIPSVRGAEGPAQDLMADLLRERGFEVDDWRIEPADLEHLPGFGRIEHDFSRARTVVGSLRPADSRGRSLILQGHCDVVPPGPLDMWDSPPFEPVVKDGFMYGRGACDMKSGTIAALFALDALRDAGLRPTGRIHFQSVIEEESTGLGALSTLQRGYRADCCLIPEPTALRLVRAQVGAIWFRLKVRGRPAHVAYAGEGSNAIKAAWHLIAALEKLEADWNRRAAQAPHFEALGHPINFNPGMIRGGEWTSSVPAWCDVDCRIAVLPGWSLADAREQILDCVAEAAGTHAFLRENPPEVIWSGFMAEGYALAGADEPEAVLAEACRDLYHGEPLPEVIMTALTDTRFYGLYHGIPGICFGPSGERIHAFNERVDLGSLRELTYCLALFVAGWCGIEEA